MAGIYSLTPAIPSSIFPYVGIISLVLGLLLAFLGESVFKLLTSIIGAILGSVIGYAFGSSLGGVLIAFVVAFVGAVVGGFLFYYVAEAGIAIILAYFTFLGILYLAGNATPSIPTHFGLLDIVAFVVALVVFSLSIIFFDDLVAVLTAIAGGLLVDYGLTYFRLGTLGTVIAIILIVAGMVYQFNRIKSKKAMKGIIKAPPQAGTRGP